MDAVPRGGIRFRIASPIGTDYQRGLKGMGFNPEGVQPYLAPGETRGVERMIEAPSANKWWTKGQSPFRTERHKNRRGHGARKPEKGDRKTEEELR